MEIKISDKLMQKLLEAQFGVKELYWYSTIYYYMIDSKLRQTKRLDHFLKEQLDNPSGELVELAQSLRDTDIDKTIVNILKYVLANEKYKYDKDNYGKIEYWATAEETLKSGIGDCDDQNSLIYILARLAGIPAHNIYCCIGDVVGGGHFWLTYWSPKEHKLVTIDSTYYPSKATIKNRPIFELGETRYKSIWYLFNDFSIWKYKKMSDSN